VPEKSVLLSQLYSLREQLDAAFLNNLSMRRQLLDARCFKLERFSPERHLKEAVQQLSAVSERMQHAIQNILSAQQQAWELQISRLESNSPVAVLQRGYALVYQEETLVRNADQLKPDDRLMIRFASGSAEVQVTATDMGEQL